MGQTRRLASGKRAMEAAASVKRAWTLRYGVAIASVALATFAAILLDTHLHTAPTVSVLLCAILFVAWFGGLGPGLFATITALLTFDYYFVPPLNSLAVAPTELPRIGLFAITALFVTMLSAAQRSSALSLRRSRDDLLTVMQDQQRIQHALRRAEASLAGENQVLEMIARGDSRAGILDAVCRLVEERARGSLSSILLLDPNTNCLRHGAAPSLPKDYAASIDGLAIGPSAGSCGTAAYRNQPVIVSDIATHPLWTDYRHFALPHGLKACWSVPIRSSCGRVLGTFATYYREPRSPTLQEQDVIQQVAQLANIAVERKQAEDVLREQARLLDLTHDTIFVRDMSDVITYWNRGAEQLYGWTAEEALRKVAHELLQTIFPASLAEINAELLRTGRWEGELVHSRRNGTQVVVSSRWSLQRDEHGVPVAILETNNDITNRKNTEQALRHAQAELAHAARVSTLGELTASIAHEVNQPLAGLVSSSNAALRWLSGQPPNIENAKQSLERIIRDAHRAGEVVARVRSLAKKSPTQKAWLNVSDAVRETMVLTRMEVAQSRASLQTLLADDMPLVWADRIQLQQVILNLTMNALEAVSSPGNGKRDVVIVAAKHPADGVIVSVRDSGMGIDPTKLQHIFDPFYTTKGEGMGMGLAISRSIIEAHGGQLWAAPDELRGAVFQFTLPVGREESL
jgi:two-component system sensor kinase FixL